MNLNELQNCAVLGKKYKLEVLGFRIFFLNIREVLERDGTAVDAAIAALFCDSLYQSSNMGPGGGFFMTIYQQSTGKVQVLNARERDSIYIKIVKS